MRKAKSEKRKLCAKYLFILPILNVVKTTSNTFRRAILYSSLLFSLLLPFGVHAALSAITTNTIHGQPPYLTFDNGVTKATTTDELLFIKLSNGTRYTPNNNSSSATKPIELPVVGQTIADVQMLIPTTANTINLSTLVDAPYNYARDDDGDGDGTNSISATGSLSLQLQDSNGNTLNRDDSLNVCLTPYYKVTLSSTAGTLTTQYGNPNSANYNAENVTYYIKPKIATPIACYAQPNLQYSGNGYDGPASQWDKIRGFKPQDINNPSSNFPTTGADNLFFYLSIAGTTWDTVSYDKSPTTSGIDLDIGRGINNSAKITLTGPKGDDSVETADTAVPTTFTVYSDTNKTNKIYSFTIEKWFIAGSKSIEGSVGYNANYCNNLYGSSYRIPGVAEYTNANSSSWTGGLAGQGGNYQRRIGGGLLAEWGNMTNNANSGIYTNGGFNYSYYWAFEPDGSDQRAVNVNFGSINYNDRSNGMNHFACVKP